MTLLQRFKTPFSEAPAAEPGRPQPRARLVGELLQERRDDLGLDLDEIGAMLRIKPSYLAALEQGRSHDLPGPAYAIGFVRAYADFLGLDSERVLARFKAEASGITARPDLALPVPLGERSLPGGALVLVALIVALCGYGIWYYLSTEDRDRPQRVAAVPAMLEAPQPGGPPSVSPGAEPPANAPSPGAATPGPAAGGPSAASVPGATPTPAPTLPEAPTPASTPAPAVASTAPAPAPHASVAPVTNPAATSPAAANPTPASPIAANPPAASPTSANAPAAAAKVSIRALADCWIQVRGPDQAIVFSRVLKTGEVYSVPARQGLSLRTGNAGALEIDVDGKPVPSIGGVGALRRDVALDPRELAAGTAVHG